MSCGKIRTWMQNLAPSTQCITFSFSLHSSRFSEHHHNGYCCSLVTYWVGHGQFWDIAGLQPANRNNRQLRKQTSCPEPIPGDKHAKRGRKRSRNLCLWTTQDHVSLCMYTVSQRNLPVNTQKELQPPGNQWEFQFHLSRPESHSIAESP